MAEAIATTFVAVRPETTGFSSALTSQLRGEVSKSEKEVGRFTRGTALGTGALHGFGRAALYASSSLLGGYGLAYGLKKVTEAAKSHQVVEGQLTAAVKAAGLSYRDSREQIDKVIQSQENLGFAESDSAQAFTLALRATKDVTAAQHLQALAADVARGRNMSLLASTQLLVRVQAGQVGSLRRLGIEVAKGVTGTQALALVQKQYAGAAQAYSRTAEGAQARLDVAIHRTEVTIGTALLPTLSRLATQLADWLDKSGRQQRIQEDVNRVVSEGTTVVEGITREVKALKENLDPLISTLEKVPHIVEIAFGAYLLKKFGLARIGIDLLKTEIASLGKTSVTAAAIADPAIASIGVAAKKSTAEMVLLRGSISTVGLGLGGKAGVAGEAEVAASRVALLGSGLKGLAAKAFVVSIVLDLIPTSSKGKGILQSVFGKTVGGLIASNPLTGGLGGQVAQATAGILGSIGIKHGSGKRTVTWQQIYPLIRDGQVSLADLQQARSEFVDEGTYNGAIAYWKSLYGNGSPNDQGARHGAPSGPGTPAPGSTTFTGEAAIKNRLTANPNDVSAIKAQIAYDTSALAFAKKQREANKLTRPQYLTVYRSLTADQVGYQDQLNQIAADAQAKEDAARARAAAAAARAATKRQHDHLVSVEIQERQLRDAAKETGDSKAADAKLVGFLKQEVSDKQLSGLQRAEFHSKLVAELSREKADDARVAAARVDQLKQQAAIVAKVQKAAADAAAKAKAMALSLKQGALDLAKQAADLAVARAGNNADLLAKANKLEEQADQGYIDFYKKRIRLTKGLVQQDWIGKLRSAQIDLANLRNGTGGAGSSFTLAQLYQEAESEFKTYGSNYGAKGGTPLSPQDVRGQYSAITLKHKGNVHVTQIFMGATKPSQAMNDARSGTRYLS